MGRLIKCFIFIPSSTSYKLKLGVEPSIITTSSITSSRASRLLRAESRKTRLNNTVGIEQKLQYVLIQAKGIKDVQRMSVVSCLINGIRAGPCP